MKAPRNLLDLQIAKEQWAKGKLQASIARELVLIAYNDIEAAEILFRRGMYSLAVFHLQQAVEKCIKLYGLRLGILERKDLYKRRKKGVGHDTPKVFEKVLTSKWMRIINKKIEQESVEKVKEDNGMSQKLHELSMMQSETLARLSEPMLRQILLEWQRCREEARWAVKKIDTLHSATKQERLLEFPKVNKGLGCGLLLSTYLSFVTYPHNASTRYPTSILSPEDYNVELGIVAVFEELLGDTKLLLTSLSLFISLTDFDYNELAEGR